MNSLIKVLLEFLLKLVAPVATFFWAKQQDKTERAEEDAKQAKHDAKAWISRPRDDSEFAARLRSYDATKGDS